MVNKVTVNIELSEPMHAALMAMSNGLGRPLDTTMLSMMSFGFDHLRKCVNVQTPRQFIAAERESEAQGMMEQTE